MSHLHRCRFDVTDTDRVRVRPDGVTVESPHGWIDIGCTEASDARRIAEAFTALAVDLDAQTDRFVQEVAS